MFFCIQQIMLVLHSRYTFLLHIVQCCFNFFEIHFQNIILKVWLDLNYTHNGNCFESIFFFFLWKRIYQLVLHVYLLLMTIYDQYNSDQKQKNQCRSMQIYLLLYYSTSCQIYILFDSTSCQIFILFDSTSCQILL